MVVKMTHPSPFLVTRHPRASLSGWGDALSCRQAREHGSEMLKDEKFAIDDIYGQYEALARMIAALPDRLRVILLPGNHDAVRPAEPQPTFPASIQLNQSNA